MNDTDIDWDEVWNRPQKIPDYGSLMTIDEFVDAVNKGYFIDYDGSGYYTNGDTYSHANEASPSEIIKGKIDRNFTHVIWFNK